MTTSLLPSDETWETPHRLLKRAPDNEWETRGHLWAKWTPDADREGREEPMAGYRPITDDANECPCARSDSGCHGSCFLGEPI